MTRPQQSLEALLSEYATGSESAFDLLFDRVKITLYSYILTVVRNRDSADEIFQYTFQTLVQAVRSGEHIRKVRSFLFKVAKNRSIECMRKRRVEYQGKQPLFALHCERVSAAQEGSEAAIGVQALYRAIDALPLEQGEILWLKLKTGMTFNEIAEALSISPKTAASRYAYGLKKLQERFHDERKM